MSTKGKQDTTKKTPANNKAQGVKKSPVKSTKKEKALFSEQNRVDAYPVDMLND